MKYLVYVVHKLSQSCHTSKVVFFRISFNGLFQKKSKHRQGGWGTNSIQGLIKKEVEFSGWWKKLIWNFFGFEWISKECNNMQNFQEQEWNLLAEMVHCKIEKGNQNKVMKLTILTFQYSSDNFTVHNIWNRSRWLTLNYWYIFLSDLAYDWQCCNIISRVNWLLNSTDYYYRPGQTKFITLP